VFEDGKELFTKRMGVKVSGMQIQRVSECYGEHIEAVHQLYIEGGNIADTKNDTVYMMADGCMVFTREEEGWKEMKVGRVFVAKDNVQVQEKRNEIVKS
jgi:ribosomal protein L27